MNFNIILSWKEENEWHTMVKNRMNSGSLGINPSIAMVWWMWKMSLTSISIQIFISYQFSLILIHLENFGTVGVVGQQAGMLL
jgi:hypothetical protein